jgi:hypothetical protein
MESVFDQYRLVGRTFFFVLDLMYMILDLKVLNIDLGGCKFFEL